MGRSYVIAANEDRRTRRTLALKPRAWTHSRCATLVRVERATSDRSPRAFAAITREHLGRLAVLADTDHEFFVRSDGRPEYKARRLVVALAQGAALHYLDGQNGVKDLDVWTFYAGLPTSRFPADKRETHADFGTSELGRQRYDFESARNDRERARWRRWDAYAGRRVDFLMRALPVQPSSSVEDVVDALRGWLVAGLHSAGSKKPTAWHLAQKAVVLVWPADHRGRIVWSSRELPRGSSPL
jgi:hypothetical protein